MTIDLSEVEFSYDFFTLPLPNGNTLLMNKVSEDFVTEEGEAKIEGINIIVALEDSSENIPCSSVIGISNEYFTINSGYSEYLGKALTADNMKYCTMEIADNG